MNSASDISPSPKRREDHARIHYFGKTNLPVLAGRHTSCKTVEGHHLFLREHVSKLRSRSRESRRRGHHSKKAPLDATPGLNWWLIGLTVVPLPQRPRARDTVAHLPGESRDPEMSAISEAPFLSCRGMPSYQVSPAASPMHSTGCRFQQTAVRLVYNLQIVRGQRTQSHLLRLRRTTLKQSMDR